MLKLLKPQTFRNQNFNWVWLSNYFHVSVILFDWQTQSNSIHGFHLIQFDWGSTDFTQDKFSLQYYLTYCDPGDLQTRSHIKNYVDSERTFTNSLTRWLSIQSMAHSRHLKHVSAMLNWITSTIFYVSVIIVISGWL